MNAPYTIPYDTEPAFSKRVAYLCMEFGIDQALKTYAGGLGFLAGSHMRSARRLRQPLIGIGVLWKFGYYEQCRKPDQTMDVLFTEKRYSFLEDTGIRFPIRVSGREVAAMAWHLPPAVFGTAPIFLLSTDLPENEPLARSISHRLYDSNPEARIAAAILLGQGSARLTEALQWKPDIFHLNESHGLPLAYELLATGTQPADLRKRVVFTNHTPEEAGNPKTPCSLLERMGYFCGLPTETVRRVSHVKDNILDHTRTALRMSGRANGVSAMHVRTWKRHCAGEDGFCDIIPVTNAQDFDYWHDQRLYASVGTDRDGSAFSEAKAQGKRELFETVADQCGKIMRTEVCTIVFAKRFAGYKRADILFHHMDRFHALMTDAARPVQFIWAGKPYPQDYNAIGVFDKIVDLCRRYDNCAILTGYELRLSRILKRGADIWINVPRLTHEASGTSGMSAAMNGAVNLALPDGWFPEFALDGHNSFVIPACDPTLPEDVQDDLDAASLYDTLVDRALPMYYERKAEWRRLTTNAMREIIPRFDSDRLAKEYYARLYAPEGMPS